MTNQLEHPLTVKRYYRPELDVLRFFAFFCVFLVHRMDLAPILPTNSYWGYHIRWVGVFGVPVFFLLSAFLITELLMKEKEQTGEVNVKSFYIRRILRIWPLYFLVLFGWAILTYAFPSFGHIPTNALMAFSFFVGNWYISINGWPLSTYPINPLWSVSVEEHFYVLIPLLASFGGRRGLKIAAYIFLAIAYLFIIYYGMHPTPEFDSAWTNSFVQFQFFSAGVLLSLYLKGWTPKWPLMIRLVVAILGIVCWLIANMVFKVQADAPHLSNVYEAVTGWMFILLGSILLLLSFLGTPAKYLPKPLVYLGRISYGLYMFHISFYWFAYHVFPDKLADLSKSLNLYEWRNVIGEVIAFILTVAISMLSYHFYEKPFLWLKKRFTLVPSRD